MFEAALKDPAIKLQTSFMRLCADAARPAHRLLYVDLAQFAKHYHVFKMLVGFFNRIQKQPLTPSHGPPVCNLSFFFPVGYLSGKKWE